MRWEKGGCQHELVRPAVTLPRWRALTILAIPCSWRVAWRSRSVARRRPDPALHHRVECQHDLRRHRPDHHPALRRPRQWRYRPATRLPAPRRPPAPRRRNYSSTCSGASDPNYDISYVAGNVTVNSVPLTITGVERQHDLRRHHPDITPLYDGLINGDTAPANPPTCTTAANNVSPAGATLKLQRSIRSELQYQLQRGGYRGKQGDAHHHRPNRERTYGTTNPFLPPTYNGFVDGDTVAADLDTPRLPRAPPPV